MTSFLTSSYCDGHRPRRWVNAEITPRPDLQAKLLRERSVPRFVVAPPGYGKSYLMLEYCQVVSGFFHTMWIDAHSPYFLRDLDEDSMFREIMRRDAMMSLVVFDDVPNLAAGRIDLLSRVINQLLEAHVEVLVGCTPACDAYGRLQKDRICLHARDLMLSDNELQEFSSSGADEMRMGGDDGEWGGGATLGMRIPQIAWSDGEDAPLFAKGLAEEELPDEVMAIQVMTLILQSGPLSQACEACRLSPATASALRSTYPHLGISPEDDTFSSVCLRLQDVGSAFSSKFERLASEFGCSTSDEVCLLLADALRSLGSCDRACELMATAASRPARLSWMLENGGFLFRQGCVGAAWHLGEKVGKLHADAQGCEVEVQQAWRLYFLGDARGAQKSAAKVAARPQAPAAARAWALLLVAHVGNDPLREGALGRLALMAPAWDGYRAGMLGTCEPWEMLAMCLLGRSQVERATQGDGRGGSDLRRRLEAWWVEASVACPSGEVAFLAGALLVGLCPGLAQNDIMRCLGEAAGERLSMAYLEAFRALSDLADQDVEASSAARELLTPGVKDAVRAAEQRLLEQKQEHARFVRREERRRSVKNGVRGLSSKVDDRGFVPRLSVTLFGGVEVTMSGRTLSSEKFTQTKMRALLALLVMEGGREVSRSRLVEALWPSSFERTARKNLYSTWASLVRVLSLPDGTCPYLHRVQGSYRVDGHLVVSDVTQVSEICRTLTLDEMEPARFRSLLDSLNRLYCGEFVPAESKIDAIVDARNHYREMVTDALVQATLRLLEMGENQMALWSARSALQHDRYQEEPYFALMSAQSACGQREAALTTYRQCVSMLNRMYRVDPSMRMVMLFRRCTEAEEEF